jgi:hypothetical protein
MRLATFAAVVVSAGCGGPADRAGPSAGGSADSGMPAADGMVAPDVDPGAPCTAPPDQRPEGGTCVLEATGHVEDLAGAPLADLVMTFCGSACFGAHSDGTGTFAIPVGDFFDTENYAVHADGRPDHAVDYVRLTHGEPQVITVTMRLPTLPPSNVLLPPDSALASNITQGDLTLMIADGTSFDLDIEDFGNGDIGRTLRVAAVPMSSAPSYALAANLDAIYALAPSGAKSSKKMGVALKNSAGLPASAAVDLLVLGDDYFSTPPNVGVLGVAAAAHVTADAQTIQTDPGEGISELTWLGVHRKGP